jgi:hypothetical protein
MRALGGDVTGMPAVMQQVVSNKSHQESGKVMDKNDPKVKGNCTLPVKVVQVRVLLTPQTHIENKHK